MSTNGADFTSLAIPSAAAWKLSETPAARFFLWVKLYSVCTKVPCPKRAVAITFDDGFHDFHSVAFPLIESFGFPVTLYLTTYYVEYNRPVFDPMVGYFTMEGVATKSSLEWPEVLPETIPRSTKPAALEPVPLSRRFALIA
jgi:hypothetical protein